MNEISASGMAEEQENDLLDDESRLRAMRMKKKQRRFIVQNSEGLSMSELEDSMDFLDSRKRGSYSRKEKPVSQKQLKSEFKRLERQLEKITQKYAKQNAEGGWCARNCGNLCTGDDQEQNKCSIF